MSYITYKKDILIIHQRKNKIKNNFGSFFSLIFKIKDKKEQIKVEQDKK